MMPTPIPYPHFPNEDHKNCPPPVLAPADHQKYGAALATSMVTAAMDPADTKLKTLRDITTGFDNNPVYTFDKNGNDDPKLMAAVRAFIPDLPVCELIDVYKIYFVAMSAINGVLNAWDLSLDDYKNNTSPDPAGFKNYHQMAVPDPYMGGA